MTETNPAGVARLAMTTIDCADPRREAEFWSRVLGLPIAVAEDEYAMIGGPEGRIGFGRVDDWQAPTWPDDGRKQFHFDLAVDDLDAARQACLDLGARDADPQPGDGWLVLLDPAGHPFCLTKAENWG